MTEFVDSISGFLKWSHTDKIKLFAWYIHSRLQQDRFSPADIASCYDKLNLEKPSSINPFLTSLEKKHPKQMLRDSRGYALEKRVRDMLDSQYGSRATTIQIHSLLEELPSKIPNLSERSFLSEAIVCLRHNAPRAAIVMCWNLAFDHLCNYVVKNQLAAFNAKWPIRYPKLHAKSALKAINKKEDFFEELKESEIIEICHSANIITDNICKILKEKLTRRNIAAHPNDIVFTPLQAEEFISDLINNAVLKIV